MPLIPAFQKWVGKRQGNLCEFKTSLVYIVISRPGIHCETLFQREGGREGREGGREAGRKGDREGERREGGRHRGEHQHSLCFLTADAMQPAVSNSYFHVLPTMRTLSSNHESNKPFFPSYTVFEFDHSTENSN